MLCTVILYYFDDCITVTSSLQDIYNKNIICCPRTT